ncbi:unnamed protein product [Ceratitis capitata]|uniref:(Mediterranean fruit fly) hypothetical protein n=2 Tax=Ceratitis capitata TaxID=7213 RepID=W8BAH3_CERCA|nr:unnamed protein product [Ceratitis capitata]
MATTMQASAAATPNAAKHPQLKRIVYSKYRELLGSYNDKANAIIETLPAYMVREDRGFHCEPTNNAEVAAAKTIITLPATLNTATTKPVAQSNRQPITTTMKTAASPSPTTNGVAAAADTCTAAALLRQVAAAAAAAAAAQGERVSEL